MQVSDVRFSVTEMQINAERELLMNRYYESGFTGL